MSDVSLHNLQPGTTGTILTYSNAEPALRRRLLMLGALPGAAFEIVRRAPLGDPLAIRVRGSIITLRRDEARLITVSVSDRD